MTVTINPNKAELSKAKLTDDFGSIGTDIPCHGTAHPTGSSLNWDAIPGYWVGGINVKFDGKHSGEITISDTDWTGKTCSIMSDGTNGVTIGTVTPLLTLKEDSGKLEFTVGDVGNTSITVTYVTPVSLPGTSQHIKRQQTP